MDITVVHVYAQQSESYAGSTPSHTVRFTDLNIHISQQWHYVLKWSSGFGINDYWACEVIIICKFRLTERVSTKQQKEKIMN